MVTLCDLDVVINFKVGSGKNVIDKPLLQMTSSLEELTTLSEKNGFEELISFKEYEKVELEFFSKNQEDRLFYDGIDLLPKEICSVDDSNGKLYLKPLQDKESRLYTIFDNSPEYYAMRKGRFIIHLLHNNQNYYQCFEVTSSVIEEEEWSIMQEELEKEMQGLSSDIIRKNMSLGDSEKSIIPSWELYKFFVIKKHFDNILAALMDLKDRPNYKVEKIYQPGSLEQATCIDNVTVRDYLKKGKGRKKYLVPRRICNYDLPENRWVKKIITEYEKELQLFENATVEYIKNLREDIAELENYGEKSAGRINAKERALVELEKYLKTAKIIKNISGLIKSSEWYRKIQEADPINIPHVLIWDVRYNAFYKMYKELQKNNISIKWDEAYAYSWKLSNDMYEIWCFIKICRFLISSEIGFEAKGWIFDAFKDIHVLVPELRPGTKVEFTKDNFKIKAYYNARIGKDINKTEKDSTPLYSIGRHIKPDIRLDLYKGDIYWCSLIIEVKYREIKNFWEDKSESSCQEQIKSYKNDYKSWFCRGMSEEDFDAVRKINPIDRVWVLHPSESAEEIRDEKEKGIKLVQLIPKEDKKYYRNIIKELAYEINMAFEEEVV